MPKGVYKRTEETKQKLRLCNLGKKHTEEWKKNMSNFMLGNKYSLGFKVKKETKLKISQKLKGKKKSKQHCINIGKAKIGNKNMLGKFHSKKTKQKLSKFHSKLIGELNPRYIKDRTKLKKRRDGFHGNDSACNNFRQKVKERDKKRCLMRNKECNGQLEVHHILSWRKYPKLRYDINNGITLCHFHHPRGRVVEEKMVEYLKELINKNNE
ncbi:MAG TPA: NUMOD3 domain-containing DNA-binding protein [Aliarcobacter cryaerophilus]|nr:NUMOD3 domain-containing DNA-binding protein [Aliarcobacter cryaerophilus]